MAIWALKRLEKELRKKCGVVKTQECAESPTVGSRICKKTRHADEQVPCMGSVLLSIRAGATVFDSGKSLRTK